MISDTELLLVKDLEDMNKNRNSIIFLIKAFFFSKLTVLFP